MKKRFKLGTCLSALLLSLVLVVPASASSKSGDILNANESSKLCTEQGLQEFASQQGVELKREVSSTNTDVTNLVIDDAEAATLLIEKLGIQAPDGKKAVKFISPVLNSDSPLNLNNEVSPTEIGGNEYYLKNVQNAGYACGSEALGRSEARADGINHNLGLNITKSVAATFSANVGISAEIVSAGVGYSVTDTFSVSASDSVQTNGKATVLAGYAKYEVKTFDIWEDDPIWDDYVGSGRALKPWSVCFAVFQ
ncbi:hypothetical protein [Paenibacillus sp. J22TS3]|uniref:hypothetical protein n=1 Tax=Paenibacillus sp. J22TS3 TaxID=2807192 RepID=UPI001B2EBA51|nr:hypothetical protein [Paenibacillus sp. J22TS3]GIP24174.1 hypothetical protein J22TS3_44490 [Paenibacillus sp. J22TS3]